MTKVNISKEDRQFLLDNGFVEGQPHTIPRNISPVLKSQLLQEMGYPGDGSSPNASADGQQSALAKDDDKGKKQNATKSKK